MRFVRLITLGLVLTAMPLPALATDDAARSCIGGRSNEHHFSTSTAVFVGRAVEQRVVPGPSGYSETETTFEVEQQWKGEPVPTTTVRTCGGGATTCSNSFAFSTGARYLVFAFGSPLRTSDCSLTATIEQAGPTVEWLQQRGK
jgi:hypothetical protein